MDTLLRKDIGDLRYEVFYDQDAFHYNFCSDYAIEFDCEEQKTEYMQKFIREELSYFGIETLKKCTCCNSYGVIDCLSGIEEESPEKALELFLNDYGYGEI